MKKLIKLGFLGLVLLACLTTSSCKKEKSVEPTPVVTSTTTTYYLTSPRQYDEADSIVVTDGTNISVPILSAYPDTLNFTFNQQVNGLPLKVIGNINVSGSSLSLYFTEYNSTTMVQQHPYITAVYQH